MIGKDAETQKETTEVFPVKFSPKWSTIVASPLLYGMFIPLVFLDLCLEFYPRLMFPLLGIPVVRRWEYLKVDRHTLSYLHPVFKVACAYCGYANGLLQYAVRIAGDTEAYFCPIKHKESPLFHSPLHHERFAEYGDPVGYRVRWMASRGHKRSVNSTIGDEFPSKSTQDTSTLRKK